MGTATSYNWKSKYGDMEASELECTKELAKANRRLKQMFADLSVENKAMRDVINGKV